MERKEFIRTIYLYLFSLVGLVLVVIGLVNLVDLGLKTYLFTNADQMIPYPQYPAAAKPASSSTSDQNQQPTPEELAQYEEKQAEAQRAQQESQKAQTASNAIAMILVGAPLFLYHWKTIQKDKRV